jgi:hypothetical protein
MSPAFFALVTFEIVACIYAQVDLDQDLSIYASHVTGMAGLYHLMQLLLFEVRAHKLFAQAKFKP